MEEQSRRTRKPRSTQKQSISEETDPRLKPPTLSSLVFSSSSSKKKTNNFTSASFRGLGCAASSNVSVPAVIRTSANWESNNKLRKKKLRTKKPINTSNLVTTGTSNPPPPTSSSSSSSLSLSSTCVGVPDVWCGLTTDDASVDCFVSRRPPPPPPPPAAAATFNRFIHTYREHCSSAGRTMVRPGDLPFLLPDTTLTMQRSRLDASAFRHHHHAPQGLSEIVMLQNSLLMGGRPDGLDQQRDLRLDVDNMSYEELLELGDRIGYVSTGLRDDEISRCLQRNKLSMLDLSSHFLTEMEKKCSICQEEYEADEEMGKLACGHFFHIHCIKQWLAQKNICPICKTAAISES